MIYGDLSWLWSHGLPYTVRKAQIEAIYRGGPDHRDYIHQLAIDYVVISGTERNQLTEINAAIFDSYPIVFANNDITIYDVRSLRQSD